MSAPDDLDPSPSSSTTNDDSPRPRVDDVSGGVRGGAIAVLLAAVAILAWMLRSELVVLFAAVFFGTALHQGAAWLGHRTGAPHGVAVAGLFVVALAGAVGFFVFAGQRLGDQYRELGDRIPAALERVEESIAGVPVVGGLRDEIGDLRERMTPGESAGQASDSSTGGVDGGQMIRVAQVTMRTLGNVGLVIVLALYIAWDGQRYARSLVRVVRPERRDEARDWLAALGHALPWWLLGRMASMAVVTALTAPGLVLLGIPLAFVLALTAGLFSFVPVLGPLAAVVPAALVTLEAAPSKLIWVLGLYAAVQLIESWVVTPQIQARVADTPPVLLLSAQLLLGVLVGFWGVMFSTPLALAALVTVQVLWIRHRLGEAVETPGGAGA